MSEEYDACRCLSAVIGISLIVLILGRIWAFFIWEVKHMPSAKILEQKQQMVAELA